MRILPARRLARAIPRAPLVALATAALLFAACGGGEAPAPSPTATATAPATATGSPTTAASPSPAPSPTPALPTPAPDPSLPGYPSEKRTGVAVVDRAIGRLLSGDPQQVVGNLSYGGFACVANPPAGENVPPCAAGQAAGTRAFYFQAGQCGYAYVLPPDVGPFVQKAARPGQRLYAAWSRETTAGVEYTVLLAAPPATPGGPPTATVATIEAGGIKALTFACGATPGQYLEVQKPGTYIVPPPS